MALKKLLAILFGLFLYNGALNAQEIKPLPLPKTVTSQNISLENVKEESIAKLLSTKCTPCDISVSKYLAMVDDVPFELSADRPLPFPMKWVKNLSIMQKKSGYEILLKVRESKKRKVMEMMQTRPKEESDL